MVDYQGVDVVPTHLGRPPQEEGVTKFQSGVGVAGADGSRMVVYVSLVELKMKMTWISQDPTWMAWLKWDWLKQPEGATMSGHNIQ